MKLDELIERLQDLRDSLDDGEVQVLVASQPGYPLANEIRNVTSEAMWDVDGEGTVWIAVDQFEKAPYAPVKAWTK